MTPGRADRLVVDRHLAALRRALAGLRRHAGVSPATLLADLDRQWTIERGLQLCAQNALDIASHLSSAAGYDPTTYGSSIDSLVEANVLPPDFGMRFRAVAGFRNVLVHGYLDVDLVLVAGMLAGSLDDFEQFARHVERWLGDIVETETPARRLPFAAIERVVAIGVDSCPAGWFFVELAPSGAFRWGVVPHLAVLVRDAREPARIFVDIPIGLPDGPGGRECDRAARRVLGARRSSVFPAPARVVLGSVDYEDAKRRSQKATGKKLSRQTFDGIVRKCNEVDQLLRGDARARRVLREVHPEICFWAFAGRKPMEHRKGRDEGFRERVEVLKRVRPAAEREILEVVDRSQRKDVRRDDAVDAMVAALTASTEGSALRTLPPNPPQDSVGLPMEMVYAEPAM